MKELDRGRPMESVHKKTGEIGRVETVYQSKALTAGCGRMDGCTAYFDKYGQPKDDFCPWVVRNVAATVDWSKPIEAYDDEGRIGSLEGCGQIPFCHPVAYAGYVSAERGTCGVFEWLENGRPLKAATKWSIRNTQSYTDAVMELGGQKPDEREHPDKYAWNTNTIPIDRALWERVEGLVRKFAGRYKIFDSDIDVTKWCAEARAIVGLLPAATDPDKAAAIELVIAEEVNRTAAQEAAIREGRAGQGKIALALAAIRKGRELERGDD